MSVPNAEGRSQSEAKLNPPKPANKTEEKKDRNVQHSCEPWAHKCFATSGAQEAKGSHCHPWLFHFLLESGKQSTCPKFLFYHRVELRSAVQYLHLALGNTRLSEIQCEFCNHGQCLGLLLFVAGSWLIGVELVYPFINGLFMLISHIFGIRCSSYRMGSPASEWRNRKRKRLMTRRRITRRRTWIMNMGRSRTTSMYC